MRRAGPILILLIGVLALVIDFWPGLQLPDSTSADGAWRPVETKLGLDLQGGLRVEYQALPVEGKAPAPATWRSSRTSSSGGSTRPACPSRSSSTQGNDRVVVELPGVTDPEAVRRLVGQTGRLDFVPLGSTPGDRGPGRSTSKQFPPLFSGDQVSVGDRRDRPERPPGRRLRPQGRRRATSSPTTPAHQRRRATSRSPSTAPSSPRRSSRTRSPTARSRSPAAASAGSRQGRHEPRHDPASSARCRSRSRSCRASRSAPRSAASSSTRASSPA